MFIFTFLALIFKVIWPWIDNSNSHFFYINKKPKNKKKCEKALKILKVTSLLSITFIRDKNPEKTN